MVLSGTLHDLRGKNLSIRFDSIRLKTRGDEMCEKIDLGEKGKKPMFDYCN